MSGIRIENSWDNNALGESNFFWIQFIHGHITYPGKIPYPVETKGSPFWILGE